MTLSSTIRVRTSAKWIAILLFTGALSFFSATPAQAQSSLSCNANFGGVIDGNVVPNPPAQLEIDGNCIIRNFPPSHPFTSNISFYGNNPTSWLVVFDNVDFTGNMSCDRSQGNVIWFTNGSISGLRPNCQNLFVPTEKIDKQNPAGQATAAIGVPFTYKLVMPVLYDPLSGTVINSSGSPNDLHDITVTDDLTATGVDMTFVSQRAYWLSTGAAISHTFSNSGGALTFGGFPTVLAGQQMVIEITVLLNDTPGNVPGKQFVNTSKWTFGRLVNGVFVEPLPGQWGISPPMTIAGPALVFTKSGPATMSLGQPANFALDVQNTGTSDAWNVAVRDNFPQGATGGMCNQAPTIQSAQVFAADGVTAVSGKGALNQTTDYSFNYSNCQLNLTMLTAAATIGPTQHLIVRYQTQLDANTQNGVTLTNVAGAIQWYNADGSITTRKSYSGPLTNGTPGVPDNQDAHTVTVALPADPSLVLTKSGPATMNIGQPGTFGIDIQNIGLGDAWNVSLRDNLPQSATGGMCTTTPTILSAQVFAADGVTPVTGKGPLNQGTDYSFSYSNCQLNITMLTAATTISTTQHLIITYRTQLDANSQNGAALTNIAGAIQWFNGASTLTTRKTYTGPLTNGTPGVPDNQDAHTVTVGSTTTGDPALVFTKSGPATMTLGQPGTFGLDVQNTGPADAWNVSLRDNLPQGTTGGMCSTTPTILSAQVFAADGVTAVTGKGPLNQGTDYSFTYSGAPNCQLNLTMLTAAGTISAAQHLIITYRTLLDTNSQNGAALTNIAGAIQWFNGASTVTTRKTYTGLLTNGTPGVADNQDAHTVTVNSTTTGDPALVLTKSGPATMTLGQPSTFGLDIQNTALGDAWNVSLRDNLPQGATGGMCITTPTILSAQVFAADGVTAVAGKGALNQGTDYSFSYSGAPNCQLSLTMLTGAATISATQHLIITYRTQLDANSQNGAALTNVAGAIQWFNADSSVTTRKTYSGPLTNGTPGVSDNQDAHTVTVGAVGDPALVLTKSGPATMNIGQSGTFGLDLQNTGLSDAWNVSLRDNLPQGATGGMCTTTPTILSAQVFAADGVTAVTGKGALNQGTDYSFSYSGAPNCQLNLTMLTGAATISATQHLIITYRTQLDANSQNGSTLTNVAGAIQWFNGDSTVTTRKTYSGPLTNGTPGVADNQDSHTVTVSSTTTTGDPALVLTKSGPATMNIGQPGTFALDIQNTGVSDAWNVSLRDLLPNGATGGMCSTTPTILSAQVFAADGVTPVAGKGPLNQGTDFSSSYTAAPNCQLDLTMLTAAGTISPTQHLIISYRTQLDATTQNGAALTNVAGAIQWFNGNSGITTRKVYSGTLTNGTPGVLDNQDAHTVTVALTGYVFSKTVSDLTSGINPATAAAPGDKLRYTLLFRATNQALNNFNIFDDMDALNAQADFAAGSLTLVSSPAGSDISNTSSTGGSKGTGVIDIRNLNLPVNSQVQIQFDITLKAPIANGTVVSNQAALRLANGTTFAWSDDPNVNGVADPTVPNGEDPTRLTIGSSSVFKVQKISTYLRDPNVLFAGDTMRYTITLQNISNANAVNVSLRDAVPANTTYVAGSTTLNGAAVADIGGQSPLVNGMRINSPADPTAGSMPVSASSGQSNVATITFNVVVIPATPDGTIISNQGFVSATGIADQPSDDPRTPVPNDPTRDIVRNLQQLSIVSQVSVVGGGPAIPGAQLDYLVNVKNIAAVPAYNVVITDDLNGTAPGQLAYVSQSATANGAAAGVSFAGSTITANYGAVNGSLAPGAVVALKFRATISSSAAPGTVITNTSVATWNTPPETVSASVSITVGGLAGLGALSGAAWYDSNFDTVQDSTERALAGWSVDLYSNNQLSQTVQTDSNGVYRITSVAPNDTTGVQYELRFRAPGAGPNTAMLGKAASKFTNGLQRISNIIVKSGDNLQGLNLPIHPEGVTYDSMTRTPLAGVTLNLLDARSAPLSSICFDDPAQQGQITLADGYYRFDINFNDPSCQSGNDYLIGVTPPPGANYVPGYSQIIPPASGISAAAFSVGTCPGGIGAAASGITFCEAAPSPFAPAASVAARSAGTTYYIHLRLDGTRMPGSSQIFNNHIPLDPLILGSITITKTTSVLNVSRGQLVPYTITATNHSGQSITGVSLVDRFPAGFTYIKGSASLDGVQTEPAVAGLTLIWTNLSLTGTQVRTLKVLFAVGAGVNEGEFTNRAQALNAASGAALSGEATATVRLTPDPTFDCTDVMGKVFNDKNRNGRQDDGEEGLAGVRVVTPNGLQATTDKYGRYHITCAIVPNGSRGSNFVLKLDDRTLPSGFRMSTDQVQIQRATSGKALQVNFGALIHRVVSIDLMDEAFDPGTTEIRDQWKPRLNLLIEELRKAPAVLRLSYVADTEDAPLVKRRVDAIKRQLSETWGAANPGYALTIEPEVFWRRGAPPKQSGLRVPASK